MTQLENKEPIEKQLLNISDEICNYTNATNATVARLDLTFLIPN